MNILHEVKNVDQISFAHQLATAIGEVRNMQVTAGSRQKAIHVLKKQA